MNILTDQNNFKNYINIQIKDNYNAHSIVRVILPPTETNVYIITPRETFSQKTIYYHIRVTKNCIYF